VSRRRDRDRHDVLVVGARCAGASTAMLLARAGLDVVLVDRAGFPSDTTSTHALVRGGVVMLQRWGLLEPLLATGTPPIRTVTIERHDDAAPAPVRLRVKDRAGVDLLVAPRRSMLDNLLVDAAVRAGASLLERTRLDEVVRDRGGRVVGAVVRGPDGARQLGADLVVGADGIRSRTAQQVGADVPSTYAPSGLCLYTYVEDSWDGFEFHVGPDAFAGVFPTHGDVACVWLMRPMRAAGALIAIGTGRRDAWLETLRRTVPGLGVRVAAGSIRGPLRGTVGLPNHLRPAWGPGWALVGDAGYHRDPITSHGMTDAFRDAELLAEAVTHGTGGPSALDRELRRYELTRNAALADTFRLTLALGEFPAPDRFTALQTELARVLDAEARALSAGPPVTPEPPIAHQTEEPVHV